MRDFKITGVFFGDFPLSLKALSFIMSMQSYTFFFGFSDVFNAKGRFPSGIKVLLAIFPL